MTEGSDWRIVGTLDEQEVTRAGRGVTELFQTLEETFGLGAAWVDQVTPAIRAVEGEPRRAIELVWSFRPEDIWLTAQLAALFQKPFSAGFEDDFRLTVTLRCE